MKSYDYFFTALYNMEKLYQYPEPYEDIVIITGLVGLYKLCFDTFLQIMKKILKLHGNEISKAISKTQSLKTVYQTRLD